MIDAITAALTAAQVETTTSLWTPSNTVTFKPVVLDQTFGDGRALFRVTTINARPRWWLVRGCSTWTDRNDAHDGLTPVFDRIDEIVQAIVDQFGGLPNMHDENADADDEGYVGDDGLPFDPINIRFPQIDDRTGSSWGRVDWPDLPGVTLEPHPEAADFRILAEAP